MVSKISKICKLIISAVFLFLTGYLWSFFYYLEKDMLWEIRIGFPFPHFGYNFMGNDCENFIWGYGSGARKSGELALLNPILCIVTCYLSYIVFKKLNNKTQQKIRRIFFVVVLPILVFCSISFLSFFPLPKQSRVSDILIGFPFNFYEYKYTGDDCLNIIKKWNILFLIINFILTYFVYFMCYFLVKKLINKKNNL